MTVPHDPLPDFSDVQSGSSSEAMPEEVAEAAIFLVSPANSYVSGQRVYVNGGIPDLNLTAPD